MCQALWKIILVGMMFGLVSTLPGPPPAPVTSGEGGVADPKSLLSGATVGGGTAPAPEGDLDTANSFLFGSLGLYGGGYYSPYYYGGGGYRNYGGHYGYGRGYGYGYPSYYGGYW